MALHRRQNERRRREEEENKQRGIRQGREEGSAVTAAAATVTAGSFVRIPAPLLEEAFGGLPVGMVFGDGSRCIAKDV